MSFMIFQPALSFHAVKVPSSFILVLISYFTLSVLYEPIGHQMSSIIFLSEMTDKIGSEIQSLSLHVSLNAAVQFSMYCSENKGPMKYFFKKIKFQFKKNLHAKLCHNIFEIL